MKKRNFALASTFIGLVGALGYGCRRPAGTAANGAPPSAPPVVSTTPTPPASITPVKDALENLLAQQATTSDSPFPKGTRLLSVDLKDGVATVDLSEEFNALANAGESTESGAQKALRAALAPIPGVEKMRVTVQGKPFESQATDWYTPFPVREPAEQTTDTDNEGHP